MLVGEPVDGGKFVVLVFTVAGCLQWVGCPDSFSSLLLESLTIAHGDGSFGKLLAQLAKTDLLILDDWGLEGLTPPQRNDLLEVIEDRHGRGSTLITSQLPVSEWHQTIGDPTLADAILDRLLHNAHRIKLEGESMRKKLAEVDPL